MERRPLTRPRLTLLVNPAAGRGRASALTARVAARLGREADVDIAVAGDPAGSQAMAAAAVAAGVDAVVALGGDGLVHHAVQALAHTDVAFGVVPAGSGNDTAAALGLPTDPAAAADAVLDALTGNGGRRIDLGQARLRDGSTRYFVTVLGVGFDAAVAGRALRLRWPSGPRRYDVAIAVEAAWLAPQVVTLTLDGRVVELPVTLVAVGNADRYGGGKRMVPHARPDDGRLAITVVGPVGRLTLARMASTLPHAGHVGHQRVRLTSADVVDVAGPMQVVADGEPLGDLPVRITTAPGALRVLVPPWCDAAGSAGPG